MRTFAVTLSAAPTPPLPPLERVRDNDEPKAIRAPRTIPMSEIRAHFDRWLHAIDAWAKIMPGEDGDDTHQCTVECHDGAATALLDASVVQRPSYIASASEVAPVAPDEPPSEAA